MAAFDENLRYGAPLAFNHHFLAFAGFQIDVDLGINRAFTVEQALGHDAIRADFGRVDDDFGHGGYALVYFGPCASAGSPS